MTITAPSCLAPEGDTGRGLERRRGDIPSRLHAAFDIRDREGVAALILSGACSGSSTPSGIAESELMSHAGIQGVLWTKQPASTNNLVRAIALTKRILRIF